MGRRREEERRKTPPHRQVSTVIRFEVVIVKLSVIPAADLLDFKQQCHVTEQSLRRKLVAVEDRRQDTGQMQ